MSEEAEHDTSASVVDVAPQVTSEDITDEEAVAIHAAAARWAAWGEDVKTFEPGRELPPAEEGKKKRKTVKPGFDERTIAVGRFRVWVFSRPSGSGSKRKPGQELAEFHIFDIDTLTHNIDEQHIAFTLKTGPIKATSLSFQCSRHGDVVRAIRESFRAMAYGYPDTFLKVASDSLAELPPLNTAADQRVVANYVGICSHMGVLPNRELIFYVEHHVHNDILDLDLSALPSVDSDSERPTRSDLSPMLLALRYDDCFRSVALADGVQPQAVTLLGKSLLTNRHLTKLVVSNVGATEQQLCEILEALRTNEHCAVEIIDLSRNVFTPKAASELVKAVIGWRHMLAELVLVDCGMQPRNVAQLFQALNDNPAVSMAINHIDMSGNKFELPGSQELDKWLSTLKVYSKLKKLVLSNASLVIGAVPSIKLTSELTVVDYSYNKFDPQAAQALCVFLESSAALQELNLSGCGIAFEPTIRAMLLALKGNNKGITPRFILADNQEIKTGIGKELHDLSGKISCIDITGVHLKEQQLLEIAQYIAPMEGMQRVKFDDTLKELKNSGSVAQALIGIVKNPTVTHLGIAGGFGRKVAISVIEALASNTSVTVLNISGNALGDFGAGALASTLAVNGTLAEINADDNHVRLNGFQALLAAFSKNKTLRVLRTTEDAAREVAALSTTPSSKQLSHVLAGITAALVRNAAEDISFWHSSSPSRVGPTPQIPTELPPPPRFFIDKETPKVADVSTLLGTSVGLPREKSSGTSPSVTSPRAAPPTSPRPVLTAPVLGAPPSLAAPPALGKQAPVLPGRPGATSAGRPSNAPPPKSSPSSALPQQPSNPPPKPSMPAPRPPMMAPAEPAAAEDKPKPAVPEEKPKPPATPTRSLPVKPKATEEAAKPKEEAAAVPERKPPAIPKEEELPSDEEDSGTATGSEGEGEEEAK